MLPWLGDAVVSRLDDRLKELIGIGPEMAENVQVSAISAMYEFNLTLPVQQVISPHTLSYDLPQVARYLEGQQYNLHLDHVNGRALTVLIFLNDVHEGGETLFTGAPKQGRAHTTYHPGTSSG